MQLSIEESEWYPMSRLAQIMRIAEGLKFGEVHVFKAAHVGGLPPAWARFEGNKWLVQAGPFMAAVRLYCRKRDEKPKQTDSLESLRRQLEQLAARVEKLERGLY